MLLDPPVTNSPLERNLLCGRPLSYGRLMVSINADPQHHGFQLSTVRVRTTDIHGQNMKNVRRQAY